MAVKSHTMLKYMFTVCTFLMEKSFSLELTQKPGQELMWKAKCEPLVQQKEKYIPNIFPASDCPDPCCL